MTVTTTARLGVYRWSADTDADNRVQFDTSHAQLEALCAIFGNTTIAALVSSAAGRLAFTTDRQHLFYDDGSAVYPLGMGLGVFGDGSDGTVVVSSNTSLSRDMYYDKLTVNAGVTLDTAGYRVFARTLLTCNGIIGQPGANGSGSTAGATAPSATLPGGTSPGSNGGTTTGVAGAASLVQYMLGGAGATGGTGSSGTGAVAPYVPQPPPSNMPYRDIFCARLSTALISNGSNANLFGGQGGGGGGGDGTNAGGGGGAGGGVAAIFARRITGTGTLSCVGGSGASPAAGNTGGGASGGGGVLWVVSGLVATSVTLTAAAGSVGVGHGTGTNGSAGAVGTIVRLAP